MFPLVDQSDHDLLVGLSSEMGTVSREVKEIRRELREDLVTRLEFLPVQRLVYGGVASALLAVIGALISLVLAK